MPAGIPDPANPLENWPYNPRPTTCSASTPTDVCNAFRASWTPTCPDLPGSISSSAFVPDDELSIKLFLPLLNNDSRSYIPLAFGDILSDSGIDRDGDGRYDELIVEVEVTSPMAGEYQVGGWLRVGEEAIRSITARPQLARGTQTVQIAFEGQQIGDSAVDGPYQVETLWIAAPDESILTIVEPEKMLAYQGYTYATETYSAGQFEVQAAAFSEGYTHQGVDQDGNGLYESVRVQVPLSIAIPGAFTVQGDLFDGLGNFVGQAAWTGSDSTAVLEFDVAKTAGPYTLEHLNLIQANGPILDSRYAPVYTIDDLAGQVERNTVMILGSNGSSIAPQDVDPTGVYTLTPVDTNGNGKYDKLVVTVGVSVTNTGGTYRIEGLLVDEHGAEVAWSVSDPQALTVGNRTMTLEFDGQMIFDQLPLAPGTKALKLVAVKIFRNNLTAATLESEAPVAVTTPAYSRSQFEPSSRAANLFQDDLENGTGKWSWSVPLWSEGSDVWHSWSHAWVASATSPSNGSLHPDSAWDLSNYAGPVLRFSNAYWMRSGNNHGYLEVSTDGGANWATLAIYDGKTPHWNAENVDLSAYGEKTNVMLRFRAQADNGLLWYVDDVFLNAWPAVKTASFTYAVQPVVLGATTTFTAGYTSIDTSLPITYRWKFGGVERVTTSPTIDYQFPTAGDHLVELSVENPYDSAVTSQVVHVKSSAGVVGLTVNVSPSGGGTVTRTPDKPDYNPGEVVTLEAVPTADWRFAGWSGDLTGENNPTTITMTSDKSVVAAFEIDNDPPDQPALVAPADGASGVDFSTSLSVTPTDPNGDPLDVTFFGMMPVVDTFTIVALPDTQNYSTTYPQLFTQQTQWIVDNRDDLNIVFVTHEGDVTNNGDSAPQEWVNASNAMYLLDAASPEVPYSIAHGNHDTYGGGNLTQYNNYFGVTHFQNKPYYGGHYGANNNHNYELFTAGGMDFIIIHIGYGGGNDTNVMSWANSLLQTYSDRRAIVTSHDVMNIDGTFTTQGSNIYNALKGNTNLFLILCGHNHDEARRQDTYNGHTIYSVLADFQDYPNGGNGWLRLLEFVPAEDEIRFKTYSPYLSQFKTDEKSQFTIPYEMDAPGEFQEIGRNTGVTSGSTTSVTWSGLDAQSPYEWYTMVSDGVYTATSPTWSFTTRSLGQLALTVTKSGSGAGTVTSTPAGIDCGTSCSASFLENSTVTLTPTADNGSIFRGWSGACSGMGACSVTMDAARTVEAEFGIAPPMSTVSFQEGINGYSGTADTFILETSATTAYGSQTTFEWDTEDTGGNVNSRKYALLRFDNLFGTGTGQIPVGSVIRTATLEYTVQNVSPGAANVHGVLVDWTEATTYNTFGTVAGVQAEDYGSLVTTAPAATTGVKSIDVTSSLAAWVNDPSGNRGWVFLPTSTDGGDVASSEFATVSSRPKLTVEYYQTGFTLTTVNSPDGVGTILKSPDQSTYEYGEVVDLTAMPTSGWNFTNWSGDLTGSTNPASVTMDGNKTITANYTQIEYALNITIAGQGSVSLDNPGPYYYHDMVLMTPVPAAGWRFDHWSGDRTGTAVPMAITLVSDVYVTAHFVQIPYTVTTSVVGQGTVSKSPNQSTYFYGDQVTLTANPSSGWTFGYWSGACTGGGACVVTVDGNETVTATFLQNAFVLTTTVTGQGSITRSPDQYSYASGTNVTLTAVPAVGWSFASWGGACTGSGGCSVTMDSAKTVTATFTQNSYTLSVSALPSQGGSVTLSPNLTSYPGGSEVQLTAVPAAGWSFTGWSGDLTGSTNPATVLMDGNKTVTASFTQTPYTLDISIEGQGSVTKNPDKPTYVYGEQVSLAANPAAGWHFANWSGDLSGTDNPATVTIDGNSAVTATFTPTCYLLTLGHEGPGADPVAAPASSAGCPAGQYWAGASIALTADPDPGYQVGGWTGTTNNSSTATTNTVSMPAGAHTASVTYEEIPPSSLVCESFDSFTPGSRIGTFTGWFDGGNGPMVTAANGVAGSTGLAAATNIYNWTAYPFNWNAAEFQKFIAQQDFKSDGSGQFDDDRLSWTTNASSTSSDNQFGVQLDNPNGGIVTYWRNGTTRINDAIVSLTGIKANTWYRFRAEISKLTATSAKIDVSLVELDAAGQPTGTPITGSIADTAAMTAGHTPNAAYFTATSMVPSYKTYNTAASAPADNTCHQVVTGAPTCYALTLSHTGQGSDPAASPANSAGCAAGQYTAGETITLTAAPASNWHISSWTGTTNNSSTANTNTVSMPASNHTAGVTYAEGSAPVTVSFQEGVTGYTGTSDTYVREEAATTESGSLNGFEWDDDATNGNMLDEISALRFDNLFGTGAGQIPPGATILSATLQYKVSTDTNAQGNPGNVYESLVDWPETVTWNTFGGDAGVNVDEYANSLGQALATSTGYVGTVNVTASLQRWSADPAANHGWLILPTGTDGVKIWSSEYTTATDRPKLTVEYISGPVTCYSLTLSHTGQGSDPTAIPASSAGCPAGQYMSGATITLTAAPAAGHEVESWTGTADDTSTATTNTVVMPAAAHAASVVYHLTPPADLTCESFDTGFTLGQPVGSHADWYDGGAGPVVTASNGVASSAGLAAAANIFTWTAHPFDWNAADFASITFSMDYQTNASGQFDDDRLGWSVSDASVDSTHQFAVQLDHSDGGIVSYWRDSSNVRVQEPIVALPTLAASTWYRLTEKVTKLTATSASIDVSLVRLDAAGNPTGTPITGSLADTSQWTAGAPAARYFTATTMWPTYKNHSGTTGAADNACFGIPTGRFAFIVASDWHTSDNTPNTDIAAKVEKIAGFVNNSTTEMPAPEFLVITGDFPHLAQTEQIIDDKLGSDFLWYPVIGNHEISDNITNFYNIRDTKVPSLPHIVDYGPTGSVNTSYSWDYGNAHFVAINPFWDGASNDHTSGGDIPAALNTWIGNDLAANDELHNFVFLHTPPFPANRHVNEDLDANPANRNAFIATLNANGVEGVFAGHTHYYEHDVAPEYALGNIHQITNGSLRAGGVPVTFTYVLVDGTLTTYKVYSWTGSTFTLHDEWSVNSEIPDQPPAAPAALAATASSSSRIDLTWDDQSEDETSFEIERSISGGAYAPLTSVAADSEGHSDQGLAAETEYCYRVRAVNAAGASGYTAPACATTPEQPPYTMTCESFDSLTPGSPIGSYPGWSVSGDGPVVTAGNGVAGSTGLGSDGGIYNWTAHLFNWNAPDFQKFIAQQDFQSNGSSQFDDDRLSWTIDGASISSNNQFGVQLDNPDGGIVTYWSNVIGQAKINDVIAPLTGIKPSTWYRFRAEITKLTATSARIDVSLVELDAAGNPTGTPITGSIADTAALAVGHTPAAGYFSATSMVPSYKNYTSAPAPADNACYEVVTSAPVTYTLTVNAGAGGTVTKDPDQASYAAGTGVTLTAVPNTGYTFGEWGGDLTGSTNPASITMDADKTISASFSPIPPTCYVLTLAHSGQGADPVADPASSVGCLPGEYVEGAAIQLTATPASGWQVASWTGTTNNSSTALINTINMPAGDHTASVTYEEAPVSISFQEGIDGYAGTADTYILQSSPDSSFGSEPAVEWDTQDTQNNASTQKFGLIRFDNLFGSGAGQIPVGSTIVSASLQYTVFNVTATGDANVNEAAVDWTEAVTYNSFGLEAGVQTADFGSLVGTAPSATTGNNTVDVKSSLTAWSSNPAANLGWIFRPAGNDGVDIRSSEYETAAERPKLTVTYFPPATPYYLLTTDVVGSGTVIRDPDAAWYATGTAVTLTAAPAAGWEFTGWSGAGCSGTGECVVTMNSDQTVMATFTLVPPTCYTLTLSHTGEGSDPTAAPANSEGCEAGQYAPGENIALSGAVPASGHQIAGWTGTANDTSTAPTNTLSMPAADHAVSVGYAPITNTLPIQTGSVWKYLDNGSDQGSAWKELAFNDSAWASGQAELGYGDGGEATVVDCSGVANCNTNNYITTYFRYTFNVPDPSIYAGLNLSLLRDDGAVVYLNGSEIWRTNMPAGTVSYNTLAPTAIGNDDETTFVSPPGVLANTLVAGTNVLAVEIHQQAITSTDISFDLELTGVTPPTCYTLSLSHTGNGANPTASPASSTGCEAGQYAAGETVTLTALPDPGWQVDSWTGTTNDTSIGMVNSVLMPADDHAASVTYVESPPTTMTCESFDSFTTGSRIGTYSGWYSDGSGPMISSGIGVASTTGIDSGGSIYNWTAHPFNWNAPDFQKFIAQQDFQSSSTGQFDDDRLSWTTNGSSVSSNNQFGVQLDPSTSGIVTYWSNVIGGPKIYKVIAPLSGIKASTWYRFRAEITKLTATSARIDVSLVELDAAGQPTGTPITGSIADTAALASGERPAAAYFTPTSVWPSYKNYTTSAAPADNACYEVVTSAPVTYTLTVNAGAGGTVTKDPDQASYAAGTGVTLTAVPETGYTFDGWSGDLSGSTNPVTITMDADKTISASFSPIPPTCYVLTLAHSGNGSNPVAAPASSVGCTDGQYIAGEMIDLSGAAADTGWRITGWYGSDNDASTASGNTVTMPASDHTTGVIYTQNQYILTVSVNGSGTVSKDPDQATYTHGESVILTPVPALGWSFSGWSGACTGTGACVVVMDGDKTVEATFTQDEYTLTVVKVGNGTVAVDPEGPYHLDDEVTLTPAADPGWTFNGWSVPECPGTGSCTVSITGDTTITATFTQDEYTLTVLSDHGTVTRNPEKATYHYGEVVQLTASPEPGWTFSAWTGDLIDNQNPASITMDGNKSVTATYTQDQYTLDVVSEHGPVSKDPDQATYTYGQTVTLTMGAVDAGWTFTGWSGAGCSGTGTCVVTVTSNQTVTATFTQDEYSLTVAVDPLSSGEVTLSDPGPYNYGDKVTLTPVAAAGWQFDHWKVGDLDVTDNPTEVTITGNIVVTAYFTQIEYTLTVTAGTGGTASKSPDQLTYHMGDLVTLTAIPDAGYSFSGWTGDYSGTENPAQITITGNMSVEAGFALNAYTLDVIISGQGTVVRNPDQGSYAHGQVVTLTANAEPGSTFTGWSGDCSGNGVCQVTMDEDKSVGAAFTSEQYSLNIVTTGSGSVTADNPGPYDYGTTVLLTATPDDGWSVAEWSVAGCFDTTCSVSMHGDRTVVVTFTPNAEYVLTTHVMGQGSIDRNPDLPVYTLGTMVELTAVPEAGWYFDHWSSGGCGRTNPCRVTMDSDKSISAYFAQGQVLPKDLVVSAGTVTESFESLGAWTVTGSGSGYGAALDTVNVMDGAASIRLTSPASGYVAVTQGVNWDLSAGQGNLRLWVYVAGTDEPAGGNITLYSGDLMTSYFVAYYGGAFKLHNRPGWNLINLRSSDWTAVNTPGWENISGFRIRLDSTSANTYSFDGLTSGVTAQPAVVFTFDNGPESLYTQAFSFMQSRNVRGTGYVFTDLVDAVDQTTWDQLLEMVNAGWTIGSQSTADVDLTTLTLAEQEAALAAARDALLAHGIDTGSHVAYPGGAYNSETLSAMANQGMLTGRTLEIFNNVLPLASPYEIAQRSIQRSTLLSTVLGWVDAARARQEILVITIQGLDASPEANEWYASRFQSLVDYIISQDMPVLTMDDLYRLQSGEITIPEPVIAP